jgi:hypothetical protein
VALGPFQRERGIGIADIELVNLAAAAHGTALCGFEQPGRKAEDFSGDRAPLFLKGVEQRRRRSLDYGGQFPAEVVGILNARIEALPTRGGWTCAASPARNTRPSR